MNLPNRNAAPREMHFIKFSASNLSGRTFPLTNYFLNHQEISDFIKAMKRIHTDVEFKFEGRFTMTRLERF